MNNEPWTGLHDATLESLELRWSSGEAIFQLRTGDAAHSRRVIVAFDVRSLACDRQMPWGPSGSVNEVRRPDVSTVEIEMQSGDVILIEARAFSVRET